MTKPDPEHKKIFTIRSAVPASDGGSARRPISPSNNAERRWESGQGRQSITAGLGGGWGLIAIAVILVAIAWRIVSETAAYSAAVANADLGLPWSAGEAAVFDQDAKRELIKTNSDLRRVASLARQALESTPIDARALTLLGLVAERQGERDRAERLMQVAGSRTKRDGIAQVWLFANDLRRGELEQGLPRIDAVIRTTPELQPQVFAALTMLLGSDSGLRAIAALLGGKKIPWREKALAHFSGNVQDGERLTQLYSILKVSPYAPTPIEIKSLLTRLIADGQFARAYRSWRESLPNQADADAYPYNRDLRTPLEGGPFDWTLDTVPGTDIRIADSQNGTEERAIHLQFSGARITLGTVGQLLVLQPGEYRFSGRVRAQRLESQRGLRWRIFCADDVSRNLAYTNLVAGTVPWSEFQTSFSVPRDACRAQWLRLEIPARVDSERRIQGEAWYEALRIEKE